MAGCVYATSDSFLSSRYLTERVNPTIIPCSLPFTTVSDVNALIIADGRQQDWKGNPTAMLTLSIAIVPRQNFSLLRSSYVFQRLWTCPGHFAAAYTILNADISPNMAEG